MIPSKTHILLLLAASLAFGWSDALAQYSSAREMIEREMEENSIENRIQREAREQQLQLELLEYEANERKLDLQSREEMLRMESLKRKDGTSAFLELITLDPTSEDYPAKEASILAKYPLAISDLEVRSILKANSERAQRETSDSEPTTIGSATGFDQRTAEVSQQQQTQKQTDEQRQQFNELKRLQTEQLNLLKSQAEEIERLKGKLDEVENESRR